MRAKQEQRSAAVESVPLSSWHHCHVLDLDDFTSEEIKLAFQTANAMKEVLNREIPRVPTLRGKTVVTLFYEPSTRTKVSFELAAKSLGADVVNLGSAGSSAVKGESLIDTVSTLKALGTNIIVVRHYQSGTPYLIARNTSARVINAGDGWHAHPTQALLDLYTIKERLGGIEGLKVVIIGDILHSRVARSNIWGLTLMGAKVVLCGPPTLLPTGLWENVFPSVTIEPRIDHAVVDADVVMTLRLQLERQQKGLLPSIAEYARLYQLNGERLARAKPNALVMHPGPMNEGIEISPEVAHGVQSVIEQQVTNGVAVRMALLYLLMGGSE